MTSYRTLQPFQVANKEYDYIVVGGGTAGCVVAARLSEDPNTSVLLIERGPIVDTWASHVPLLSADYRTPTSPVYSWTSQPVAALGRTLGLYSGKAMGGTSKVNAAIYTRSTPGEYNGWADKGRKGWGWNEVEKWFQKSEKTLTYDDKNRGHDGPWTNQSFPDVFYPWADATRKAAPALGIPDVKKANDPSAPAVTCVQTDVTVNEKMRRISAFDAFLPKKTVNARKNLSICTRTIVLSLDLEDTGALKAKGVFIQAEDSWIGLKTKIRVGATKEIIMAAGAIATPQILLLSGIGDPKHLNSVGIDIVHELNGVGLGLQDHIAVPVVYKVPRNHTIYELQHNPLLGIREFFKYIFTAKGLFLSAYVQVALFVRSGLLTPGSVTAGNEQTLDANSSANIPDIEIQPIAYGATDRDHKDELAKGEGAATLLVQLLRPKSSGSVKLANRNARDRPKCELGSFTKAEDWTVLRKGLKLALALGRQMKKEDYPCEPLDAPTGESDAELDAFIKLRANTTFHYSSSCRMAPQEEGGVVDDELRVHGIVGLRIADASVFPTIPACHLQAPVVMIGERCAGFILGTKA